MNDSINILITGDTHLGGGRVKELALNNTVGKLFGDFTTKIQEADISITNLESPLIEEGTPILKTGPNLKSPVETVNVLKNVGFNLLTLANNHIMDYGEEGLISTLETCHETGLKTVGAGINEANKCHPFITEISDISLSIINIAENEFSTLEENSSGAHALNPVKNYNLIKEYSNRMDHVIVIVHGGHENYQLPSPRMKEAYRFFIDSGATAVIGHHTHCFSGYEEYNNAPIFYSIGNFLFDKIDSGNSGWCEGYMINLKCKKNDIDYQIIPYKQNNEHIGLNTLNSKEIRKFDKRISSLNDIIQNDMKLEEKFLEYCQSKKNEYSAYIEPHSNKYLHALRNRGLFPSLISDRKRRLILNLIRCEAHRDVLINILKP